jgi:diguanylate cyclase (GGDEF)-like protein
VTFRSLLRRLTHVPTALAASLVLLLGVGSAAVLALLRLQGESRGQLRAAQVAVTGPGGSAAAALGELIAGQRSLDARRATLLGLTTGATGVLLLGLFLVLAVDLRRRRAARSGESAGTDPSVLAEFQSAARAAVAAQVPLSCVIVEVDRYAEFMATQGPAAGEVLLDEIHDIVRQAVRASDTAFRTGPIRFVLALPDTAADAAMRLAERIRESIVRALLAEGVTVSGGVAGLPSHAADGADLLAAAEAALADAQRRGRNRVRAAVATTDEIAAARDNLGRR